MTKRVKNMLCTPVKTVTQIIGTAQPVTTIWFFCTLWSSHKWSVLYSTAIFFSRTCQLSLEGWWVMHLCLGIYCWYFGLLPCLTIVNFVKCPHWCFMYPNTGFWNKILTDWRKHDVVKGFICPRSGHCPSCDNSHNWKARQWSKVPTHFISKFKDHKLQIQLFNASVFTNPMLCIHTLTITV